MGIEYIAASLKKAGHQVKMIFDPMLFWGSGVSCLCRLYDYSQFVIDEVLSFKPDLIGISVLSDTYS